MRILHFFIRDATIAPMDTRQNRHGHNASLTLFSTFFRIGLFTFGGGYAMIPLIEKEIVKKHGWIDQQTMLDMIIVAESTPGVIAVNMATFVGYRVAKLPGAILATLGVVLPSFLIILLISGFITQYKNYTLLNNAFKGIRVAVGVLICSIALNLTKQMEKKALNYCIFALVILLCLFLQFNSFYVILAFLLLSLSINIVKARGDGNNA